MVLVGQSLQGCVNLTTWSTPSPVNTRTLDAGSTHEAAPATDTPTPVPFRIDASCWAVTPLSKGEDIRGSIVFQGNRSNPAFIWDVSSFHAQALKLNLDLQLYSISPDGTSIASLSYVENKLSLISAESTKSFWLPEATYGEISSVGLFL